MRLIDCVCLNVLVQAARAARARHRTLRLAAPSPLVRLTLRCTGTESVFTITGVRPEA